MSIVAVGSPRFSVRSPPGSHGSRSSLHRGAWSFDIRPGSIVVLPGAPLCVLLAVTVVGIPLIPIAVLPPRGDPRLRADRLGAVAGRAGALAARGCDPAQGSGAGRHDPGG